MSFDASSVNTVFIKLFPLLPHSPGPDKFIKTTDFGLGDEGSFVSVIFKSPTQVCNNSFNTIDIFDIV